MKTKTIETKQKTNTIPRDLDAKLRILSKYNTKEFEGIVEKLEKFDNPVKFWKALTSGESYCVSQFLQNLPPVLSGIRFFEILKGRDLRKYLK